MVNGNVPMVKAKIDHFNLFFVNVYATKPRLEKEKKEFLKQRKTKHIDI